MAELFERVVPFVVVMMSPRLLLMLLLLVLKSLSLRRSACGEDAAGFVATTCWLYVY